MATGTEASIDNDGFPGYPALLFEQLQARYPDLCYENLGRDGETSSTMIIGRQLVTAEQFIASEQTAGRCIGLVTLDSQRMARN